MNIREKIERIEALEAEFNKRLKALKEEVQREDEFPQYKDTYYYIQSSGRVDWLPWVDDDIGLRQQGLGNVFRTKEQAEFAVEKLKVEAELRKYSKHFENGEFNYYIFFYIDDDDIEVGYKASTHSQGTIYFESEEKAQQAIKSVGEERIKKYIFGLED